MNVNLIKLQHFFEVDNKIKKEMYNNVPPSDNEYLDSESLCKYTKNLEDSLIYIFSELKCVSVDLFGIDFLNQVERLEVLVKNGFYSSGLDIDKLRAFYKIYISNMSASFVNEVKANCVAYLPAKKIPIGMASSVNEILHLMHAAILNDERVLRLIPAVAEKNNKFDKPISLRGKPTALFKGLYENFPYKLDVGRTEMVCINERKMLMMVRDRGHALTIEITLDNNVARIEYFIPNIFNVTKINMLPGINKITPNSVGATGVIQTDINSLPDTLYKLISKVPTDTNLRSYGKLSGTLYGYMINLAELLATRRGRNKG